MFDQLQITIILFDAKIGFNTIRASRNYICPIALTSEFRYKTSGIFEKNL